MPSGEKSGGHLILAQVVRNSLRHKPPRPRCSGERGVSREFSDAPLREFTGIFRLLAEEQQETSSEALALRWLRAMCEALNVLHRNGLSSLLSLRRRLIATRFNGLLLWLKR